MTGTSTAHSVVEASSRGKWIAGGVVVVYALITMVPLVWIFLTGFKSPPDSISYPPKVFFEPSLEGYVNLFTNRSRQTPEYMASLPPPESWYDELVRSRNMVITGPSRFADRYVNSIVIGFGSTFLAVFLGTLAAYGFSRFKVPLKDDLLFFILSTRMMPPIAVAIPIYLMYRTLGLSDTALGMILLPLRTVEAVFPSLLPVSSGQFASFNNDGTVTANELVRASGADMKGVDDMIGQLTGNA